MLNFLGWDDENVGFYSCKTTECAYSYFVVSLFNSHWFIQASGIGRIIYLGAMKEKGDDHEENVIHVQGADFPCCPQPDRVWGQQHKTSDC